MRKLIILLLAAVTSACNLSKKLPTSQYLHGLGSVSISDSSVSISPSILAELEANLVPKKNTFFMGSATKVGIYYSVKEPKKPKGIRNFLKNKVGEAPIFYQPSSQKINKTLIQNTLRNYGYFNNSVAVDTAKNGKVINVAYTIHADSVYRISSLKVAPKLSKNFPEIELIDLIAKEIKVTDPYNLNKIIKTRSNITTKLRNRGYYYVSDDQFVALADTSNANYSVDLLISEKKNTNPLKSQKYKVGSISVKIGKQKEKSSSANIKGLQIYDPMSQFRPILFERSIVLDPQKEFSLRDHEVSLARLSNLKNFKFIRSKLEIDTSSTEPLINTTYHLTPQKKKALKARLSGLAKNNGFYGSEGSIAWENKNFFGGAERLSIEINGGLDIQFGQSARSNTITRLSTKADLTFPRFLFPFKGPSIENISSVPSTSFSISYDRLRNQKLFTQTSLNGELRYDWKKNTEFFHSLTPAYINFIKPNNISEDFVNDIFASDNFLDLQRYFQILEPRLILGLKYNLDYTPKGLQSPKSNTFFHFDLDLAGNLASIFAQKNEGNTDFKNLFGVPYEQFAIGNFEVKQFNTFGNFQWANRAIIGLGIPYKNSGIIPQVKQFFVGGGYGLRGFRARSIGPGTVSPEDPTQSLFGFNTTGDIKLEYTSELRQKLGTYFETALFVDAGNIWLYNDDTFLGPDAQFTSEFYKQFAVDMGVGLRLDFDYIILRTDLAIPIRKPWFQENPWVFDQIQFGNKEWRQNNLILNLAIGYPF